jgi:Uma2 family endonuclease
MSISTTTHMSEADFREFSLGDPQGQWELVDGQLRERPGMSVGHGHVMQRLLAQLYRQLDPAEFEIRTQHARLRVSSNTYYIPDIAVIPAAIERALREHPRSLDAYPDPLPLVVEIWSPSTGDYDINEKLPGYQRRGDRAIWSIHPSEQTLTTWCWQPDGAYGELLSRGGHIAPGTLPGVLIDLDALFAP